MTQARASPPHVEANASSGELSPALLQAAAPFMDTIANTIFAADAAAPAPAPASPDAPVPDESALASRAVLTQIILLAAALVLGQYVSRRKITIVGDSAVALLLGLAAGVLCYYADFSDTYLAWMAFSKEFFFYGLLPPIIFEAGYSLETKPFVRNLGAICAYAFAGTFISTVAVGVTMWAGGQLHLSYRVTLVQSLLYGAIISATDLVTVLSVFQRLNAHPDLYALVFGESVLNDAVAITLYKTFLGFLNKPVTMRAIAGGLQTFFWSFAGSLAIGSTVGLASSLLFKTRLLRTNDRHLPLEANVVILFAFASYFIADGLNESGIVAVLFCGMTMANYTRRNLSDYAQQTSMAFFQTWATMAETFVFVYIGASVFLQTSAWGHGLTWGFLVLALVALAHSRLINIWLCSKAVNLLRTPETRIPLSHQTMLWWSGLRGAIAFALSLQAVQDLPDGPGEVMLTCTFSIILITVLVNGGGCTFLLERLRLKASDSIDSRPTYLPVAVRDGGSDLDDATPPFHPLSTNNGTSGYSSSFGSALGGEEREGLREVQLQPQSIVNGAADADGEVGQGPVDRMLGTQGADAMLHKSLESVRRFNQEGIQGTLSEIDQNYLQPFFVARSPGSSPRGEAAATTAATAAGQTPDRPLSDQSDGRQTHQQPQQQQQQRPHGATFDALSGLPTLSIPNIRSIGQMQPRRSLHDDEPPTPPYLRSMGSGSMFEARRRSVTDSTDLATAQPLAPYEREPSAAAPPLRTSSGSASVPAALPPRGAPPALQALQTRLAAVLKRPGGSGSFGGLGSGRAGSSSSSGEDRNR